MDEHKGFNFINKQISFILTFECFDPSEEILIKHDVQEIYNVLVSLLPQQSFMNFGLWDEKLFKEFQELNVNLSSVYTIQDINSQLLHYYLVRPLIKAQFFHKKLLEIGSGMGIGLKASSELLKTDFALGVDLVKKLATNSHNNFYQENKINYIQSDAERLPLENESFDIITNLESSHVYPHIEHFFSEVERVLSPGGYFVYSDIQIPSKQQDNKFEAFIKTRNNLKIIQKVDITKMVQSSIYKRLIENEEGIHLYIKHLYGDDYLLELSAFMHMAGFFFLPWWKIKLKNPLLQDFAKHVRKRSFWIKKCYFYYLIQKI